MADLEMLEKHLGDLKIAIATCYSRELHMPCLVLLYSGIDAMASLEPSRGNGVGARYERWVSEYLLTSGTFTFTATDLYAARCGVVHTFTPESNLYKTGKARQVGYAWGPQTVEKLDKLTQLAEYSGLVNVHVSHLIEAFYEGCLKHLHEVFSDPNRMAEVKQNGGLWTSLLLPEKAELFIALKEGNTGSP